LFSVIKEEGPLPSGSGPSVRFAYLTQLSESRQPV